MYIKYETNEKANGQDSIDEKMWENIFLFLKPGPDYEKKCIDRKIYDLNLPALIIFS